VDKLYQQLGDLPAGPVAQYFIDWAKYLGSKFPRPWESPYGRNGCCKLCGRPEKHRVPVEFYLFNNETKLLENHTQNLIAKQRPPEGGP
jgi:hypothetical protein